jgi:hypothetical protein
MVVEGASHQFELRQQPESAFFTLQVNMASAQGRQTSRGLGSIPWQFFLPSWRLLYSTVLKTGYPLLVSYDDGFPVMHSYGYGYGCGRGFTGHQGKC